MRNPKAVAETVLAGFVMAAISYWQLITPATLVALSIRRKNPEAWFSSMIVWYAAFAVIGISLIVAVIASRMFYRHITSRSQRQNVDS